MPKSTNIALSELLSVCISAGKLACERIREIHSSGDLLPIEKGNGKDIITGRPMADIQTEADRQSEAVIFTELLRVFPSLRIIGEEESSGHISTSSEGSREHTLVQDGVVSELIPDSLKIDLADTIVFVDPLDGTSEFVHGRLHCVSVIIGIAHKGRALAGVICRPFPDAQYSHQCMYGVVGIGSFVDTVRLSDDKASGQAGEVKVITSLKKGNRVTDRFFQLVPSVQIREGGAGWKCWQVAVGEAHCYQYARPGTKKWDIIAGDAIITALGGAVTDACGHPFKYETDPKTFNNSWGVLATRSKSLHVNTLVPAAHKALTEAAADLSDPHWPSGLAIPAAIVTYNHDSSL